MTQTTPQDLAAQIEALEEKMARVDRANTALAALHEKYPDPAEDGEQDRGFRAASYECDVARALLNRAAVDALPAIVAAIRQGEGMVLVPRVLPQEVRDAMTEVVIMTGIGGKTTALNWEEAQEVWDAALSALGPIPTGDAILPPAPDERDDEVRVTLAAGAIIDIMTGGNFDWRSRLDESDFLESADWMTAVAYARAALSPAKGWEA